MPRQLVMHAHNMDMDNMNADLSNCHSFKGARKESSRGGRCRPTAGRNLPGGMVREQGNQGVDRVEVLQAGINRQMNGQTDIQW